jgi:TonB family protein
MKVSIAARLVASFLVIAGFVAIPPVHAESDVCKKEKIDVLVAHMDVIDARRRGVEPPDPTPAYQAANACLKAHGFPEDPTFSAGDDGVDSAEQMLLTRYTRAIQRAVRANWQSPEKMPGQACQVRITQLPGGEVVSVTAEKSCPYDAIGKRSVEKAVLRSQPLPYKGFESVFQRTMALVIDPRPDKRFVTRRSEEYHEYIQVVQERVLKKGNEMYPTEARKNHWHGNVMVTACVRPDGSLSSSRLVMASGIESLDRSILEAFKAASPFPAVPASKDGFDELCITTAFSYAASDKT